MPIIPSGAPDGGRIPAPDAAGEAEGLPRRLPPMPGNDLALNLVRTTEAAALGAARWVGRGDKNAADRAAVDAMRLFFNAVPMAGVVVIGEGEKDEAPMLYNGERIGTGSAPEVDVAVDPIDGTRLVAQGQANALSVVAVAARGAMFDPGPCVYMEKIVAGREGGPAIDITAPIEDNIRNVARARGMAIRDVTVMILDRPRHEDAIRRVRSLGARAYLLPDGDVAGAITAARRGTGVDAAAALKCLGGAIQGRLYPRDDRERRAALDAGYDLDRVLTVDDLVKGDDVFFACTGITDGALVQGVRFFTDGATTESIVMRASSGTIRVIRGEHRAGKLRQVCGEIL